MKLYLICTLIVFGYTKADLNEDVVEMPAYFIGTWSNMFNSDSRSCYDIKIDSFDVRISSITLANQPDIIFDTTSDEINVILDDISLFLYDRVSKTSVQFIRTKRFEKDALMWRLSEDTVPLREIENGTVNILVRN